MEKPDYGEKELTTAEEPLFEPGSHFYWLRFDRMLSGDLLISREEELILAEDPNNFQEYLELIDRFVTKKAPGISDGDQVVKLEEILDDPDNSEEFRELVRDFVVERTIGRDNNE